MSTSTIAPNGLSGFSALRPVPQIGFGRVWHKRIKPVVHVFAYPTYFLMLPMRAMRASENSQPNIQSLARNHWSALSFYDKDHGDVRGDA